MRLCLIEDALASDLEPLTLTRPTFELVLGAGTIECKIRRALGFREGPRAFGVVVRPHLVNVQREREPVRAVNDRAWLSRGDVLVANGRWVPPAEMPEIDMSTPWLAVCDDQPACAFVGGKLAGELEWACAKDWFEELGAEVRCFDVGGEWIERPWDLVTHNAEHLVRDFLAEGQFGVADHHRQNVAVVGPADRLLIHESAKIDPYTVFDTTHGPISVGPGAWVQPFTRIEGPAYVGRDTQLFRANLRGGVTLGPNCRIGGEVEASIVHGHSNKYHEGFLGHAYVGEWVNLGAITSNSDLRNDYGEVFVPLGGDLVATGQAKVGCYIGDHTRTALGSMLNTGTSLGVMCNVIPSGPLLPKHVPSFTAVLHGRVCPGSGLEKLFATARIVTSRRGRNFSEADEALYADLFEQTTLERERAIQRSRDRREQHWPVAALACN